MNYYVIHPSGERYGPTDVDTLNKWSSEGRLNGNSEVEDAQTGQRMQARNVPGFIDSSPIGGGFQQPPGVAGYPRGHGGPYVDGGQNDVTLSYVFSAISLVSCCLLVFLGIHFANRAQQAGHPNAKTAKTFAYAMFGIELLFVIGYVIFAVFVALNTN